MYKRKLAAGDFFLVLANLLPLYGVWFEGWDPRQMFLVYCLETIIIGGYNVIKMIIVTFHKKKDMWQGAGGSQSLVSGWFFILFFIVHYGFFVFVQTSIFAGASGLSTGSNFGPFNFLGNIFSFLNMDAKTVLYIFIAVYGIKMFIDFIYSGRYKETSISLLMFQPYLRIIIQQFVVIIGSMFLTFGAGKIFMLIFVCVKILAEVYLNFDAYLYKAGRNQRVNEVADNSHKATTI